MTTHRIARHLRNTAIALAGIVAFTSGTGLAGPVQVEGIETRETASGQEVVIRTSDKPTFSVFRLSDPFRILVDVSDAALRGTVEMLRVREGVIRYVDTRPFTNETSKIVRVEIGLEREAPYSVNAEGHSIVVKAAATSASAPTSAAETSQSAASDEASAPRSSAPTSAVHVGPPARLGRLDKRRDGSKTVLEAKLLSGQLADDAVTIQALENPSRLVVDVKNAEAEPRWQRINVGAHGVARARLGTHEDGLRLVLDVAPRKPLPAVDVAMHKGRLQVRLTKATRRSETASIKPSPTSSEATSDARVDVRSQNQKKTESTTTEHARASAASTPASREESPSAAVDGVAVVGTQAAASAPRTTPKGTQSAQNMGAKIVDVRFEPKDGFVRLTVELDRPISDVTKSAADPNSPAIRLSGVALPKALERTLDVASLAGQVVSSISSYTEGQDTVLAASIDPGTEHRHWQKGNRLMWDFRGKPGEPAVIPYPEQVTSGYSAQATSSALRTTTLAPRKEQYQGRRISLDLKDAEIQNVLRLLADVSKLNIVAGDDVKGRLTIKLRNVPWDQALDIILRSKQLDKTRQGNIVRIAPIEVLRKEEELRIERAKARIELEPLTVRLIPVSYAVANEIKPQVSALLSPRGKVNIDKRTNVLVVEDISEVLLKVERLVRTLDTQTPQVLIEARIVEARSSFSRDLGIQWGGNVSMTPQFGTSTGLAFPNTIRVQGSAVGQETAPAGVMANPGFAVNLPAAVGLGSGGALGFILGSAGGSTILNLRLSAAEEIGKVKIISSPKIVTIDNKEAKILSGEKIPITVVTANGPSTRFINANIELNVTPHVTQDGSILMKIQATKNELSDRVDLLGVPGIITKEAETEMIVRDGDTAVLGGLYRRTASENQSYVPWFGKIPVLGWIFKQTQRSDARDELLIFISPRIVNRAQALVATE